MVKVTSFLKIKNSVWIICYGNSPKLNNPIKATKCPHYSSSSVHHYIQLLVALIFTTDSDKVRKTYTASLWVSIINVAWVNWNLIHNKHHIIYSDF